MPPETTSYDTKKIIIFGVILLVIVGIIGFLIFRRVTGPTDGTDSRNLFPFDDTILPPDGGLTSGTSTIPNPVADTSLSSTTAERLRIIASYPVTAFHPFIVNKTETELKYNEVTGQNDTISKVVPVNYIRYNAKQNGFLVDAEMRKNIITISQKTDVVIPNSQEVWFGNNGNTVTLRSWDPLKKAITSFNGSLPSPTSIDYCAQPLTTVLKTKSKGDEVKNLQKYINAKLAINLTVDGIYGAKIAAAIKPLQKILLLPETGTYDQALINAINADCTNLIAAQAQQVSGTQPLTGDFLQAGILRGSPSPDGSQIFYLKPTLTGVIGVITTSTGRNERQVFTSPLTEWKAQWVNPTLIALTTLASSEADGYLYFLNPITGELQKILGPVRGLTTLVNPSGNLVLVGSAVERTISLSVYSVATGNSTSKDLKTLPAKCVWQNDTVILCAVPDRVSSGQYPDDWYQGNVVFNDSFWSIDVDQNSTTNLFIPNQSFDAYALDLSPDEYYLYFINKINGTLWSYRLGE